MTLFNNIWPIHDLSLIIDINIFYTKTSSPTTAKQKILQSTSIKLTKQNHTNSFEIQKVQSKTSHNKVILIYHHPPLFSRHNRIILDQLLSMITLTRYFIGRIVTTGLDYWMCYPYSTHIKNDNIEIYCVQNVTL